MDEFLSQLTDDELLALYSEIDTETKEHAFCLFSCYNARDVEVLVKLDQKFKFMQLVNQMAHENTVDFSAILGTVRYVETGIMNRAHYVHHLICTDKQRISGKNKKVEGAVVMTPWAGLHEWLGSVDITSLYPSVIRALNMSIETFVGQFDDEEVAWSGIIKRDDKNYRFTFADGSELVATGAEWAQYLLDTGHAISAFGTVFDQSKPGMVADTLTYWFNERVRLNAEKKKYGKLAKEEKDPVKKLEYQKLEEHYDLLQLTKKIQLNSTYGALLNEAFRFGRREIGASVTGSGRQITRHMSKTIASKITGRPVELMKRFVPGEYDEGGMVVRTKAEVNDLLKPRRGRNQGRKVSEPYAVALQTGDMEMLLGLPKTAEYKLERNPDSGEYEHAPTGAIYWPMFTDTNEHCNVIIYGDTDSCYFLTKGTDYEDAVKKADDIAEFTNASFPAFMASHFNCTEGRENLIKAAREIVGERGLFLRAKKKYTIRVVNLDGVDLREKPKLKSMGSEIKKADTPKVVQDFLKNLMNHVLEGAEYDVLEKFVNSHRGKLIRDEKNLLALAPAKQVNNLDALYAEYQRTEKNGFGKVKLPGHVRAAVNYNEMISMLEPGAKPLRAGDKAAILYVKPNDFGMKSIGFPTDLLHLPPWFDENFIVDLKITEEKMIDSKIDGIFEAMDLDLPTPQQSFINSVFSF
jgi:DNA polymerase elongation subunit (family B)